MAILNANKKTTIIFPENSGFVISEILKKYNLNESNDFEESDFNLDWSDMEDYYRDNYNFDTYYKSLGDELFDFMADHEYQNLYDNTIEKEVDSTTIDDFVDEIDRLKEYLNDNSSEYKKKLMGDSDEFYEDFVEYRWSIWKYLWHKIN